MEKISVSVIVCTYNGEKKIRQCLKALENQEYPKEKLEIVIVDDCSTDNTVEVVKEFSNVKLIRHHENYGLGKSRNTGIMNSVGEIIVFTDDDCIPDKFWIYELAKIYKKPEIDGVGGKIEPFSVNNIIEKYIAYSKSPIYMHVSKPSNQARILNYFKNLFKIKRNELQDQQPLYHLMGANSSYRRKLIEYVEGCDDNLRRGVDWDLSLRLHKKFDLNLIYSEKAIIYHKHRSNIKNFIKHMYQYGKAQSIVAKKHKFFNFPYLFPSMIVLFSILYIMSSLFRSLFSLDIQLFNLFNFINTISMIILGFILIIYLLSTLPYSIKVGIKKHSLKIIFLFPIIEIIREFSHSVGTFIGYFKNK